MTVHGDEGDLFAQLNGPLVAKLTSAFGGDRHLAEEAATFAWLMLLRRQPDRSPTLGGWLYVTGLHEGWSLRRRRSYEDLFEPPELPDGNGTGRDPLEIIRDRHQLQLLNLLPAPQRLALTMVASGYSYREIATATGHTYTWVNRQLTKGRARLRSLLEDEDQDR